MSSENVAPLANSSLVEPLLPQESTEPEHGAGEGEQHGGNDERDSATKSRNVNYILAYTVLSFAGRSLWSQSALSAFVYLLRDSNPEYVGYLTAAMGGTQLLASCPSGYLADKYRRDGVLHAASVVGVIAAGVTVASVLTESYALLGVALSAWGCFWGMANTSVSALFADSIRDGDRLKYFTHRMVLVKVGNLFGPLAALLMFALQGDSWTTHDCAIVMGAGQIVCLPGLALLCFLSDDHAVDKGKVDCKRKSSAGETTEPVLSESVENLQPASPEHLISVGSSDEGEVETTVEEATLKFRCCIPVSRRIPALVAASDLTGGIAAGMSVRYFPIFLLDNVHLDPVRVQVVYALAMVFQIFMSHVALKGGQKFGRCQMAAVLRWSGVLCFALLIVSYEFGLPSIVILALFVGRMGLMNSTSALTKSIVMDAVPRNERGKWSALESVNMFSWAGSAAIGGWLVQAKGIVFNFCVTATLQVVATIPLVVLFGETDESDVRREGGSSRQRHESRREAQSAHPRSGRLDEELAAREGHDQRSALHANSS